MKHPWNILVGWFYYPFFCVLFCFWWLFFSLFFPNAYWDEMAFFQNTIPMETGSVSIFFRYFVYKKEKDKNINEIKVLYFIYNRTFQYGDMSLIYLFTNIFIHYFFYFFVQVLKNTTCFLYRKQYLYETMCLHRCVHLASLQLYANKLFWSKNLWWLNMV